MEAVVVHVVRLKDVHVQGYVKLCSEIWNTHIAITTGFRVQERAGVLKLKSSDALALTRGEIKRRPNCNLSLKNTETLQLHKRSHLSGPPL